MARRHRLRARRARYPGSLAYDALEASDPLKAFLELSFGIHERIQRLKPLIVRRLT